MAVAFGSVAESNTGTTTLTVTMPSGITAGDALVAFVEDDTSSATPTFTGWTRVATNTYTSGSHRFSIYTRVADGTEGASMTMTGCGNSFTEALVIRYTGTDPASPFDASSVGSDTATIPSITTTVDNCMQVACMSWDAGSNNATAPSGFTARWTNFGNFYGGDRAVATAGATATSDWSTTGAGGDAPATIALRPASAATSIPWTPPRSIPAPTPTWQQWLQRTAQVIVGTAANPLPSPLDAFAQGQQHAYTFAERRVQPQQRPVFFNFTTVTPFDPTLGGLNANYKPGNWPDPNRADWQQKRLVSAPGLLSTALLENELLGDADNRTRQRLQPATHVDRRMVPQQRSYISNPSLLSTALLEDSLVVGILPAYKWASWPDPNRADWQQRLLVSDPNLLATALLEDALLGIHPRDVWRRDWYFYPWVPRDLRNAILVGTPANPLPSPLDVWQQMPPHLQAAYYVDRRVAGQQRALVSDPLLLTPLANVDPTQAGYLGQEYWWWQRLPYWTPPGPRQSDPGLLLTALLEDALLTAGAPKTPWRRDGYEWPQRQYAFDPNELIPPGTFDGTLAGLNANYRPGSWPDPNRAEWQQKLLVSDPALLLTALLENELLGGAGTAARYNQPATHADRREVPQQRVYYDLALLATALLEDALLGIRPREIWRRDGYQWPQRTTPGAPADLLDPTQAGYLPARYWAWRRDPSWTRPVPAVQTATTPPTPFDPTQAGLDWRRLNAWFGVRPDSAAYWQQRIALTAVAELIMALRERTSGRRGAYIESARRPNQASSGRRPNPTTSARRRSSEP